jgi:hypothetical protein
MTELPVCKLCGSEPDITHTDDDKFYHYCPGEECTLDIWLTEDAWITLMGADTAEVAKHYDTILRLKKAHTDLQTAHNLLKEEYATDKIFSNSNEKMLHRMMEEYADLQAKYNELKEENFNITRHVPTYTNK